MKQRFSVILMTLGFGLFTLTACKGGGPVDIQVGGNGGGGGNNSQGSSKPQPGDKINIAGASLQVAYTSFVLGEVERFFTLEKSNFACPEKLRTEVSNNVYKIQTEWNCPQGKWGRFKRVSSGTDTWTLTLKEGANIEEYTVSDIVKLEYSMGATLLSTSDTSLGRAREFRMVTKNSLPWRMVAKEGSFLLEARTLIDFTRKNSEKVTGKFDLQLSLDAEIQMNEMFKTTSLKIDDLAMDSRITFS
ncbi:MAG: hypothetical protein KDD22_06810, partial [Bdellovibrionales bacterium]|nr:hypothetical protein [Bdellovibrionales bacterium]